jgi:hypothetical protein
MRGCSPSRPSERCRGPFSTEIFQELAGRILMDARDNDLSFADMLLNDHCFGSTGSHPHTVILRKYPIAFDGSRIIIIDDGPGAGTGCKCNAPRVAVMPVHNAER